jgi:hypothetical protein
LEGGPPVFGQDGSCPALLMDTGPGFPYGAVTRSGPPFQALPVPKTRAAGLVRVRSPLLTESRLMSVPPATEMFQFAGFASRTYRFSTGYPQARTHGWVAPFGNPGITDRSHLPRAFRSVPRPSSPLSAKASTRCPCLALPGRAAGSHQEPCQGTLPGTPPTRPVIAAARNGQPRPRDQRPTTNGPKTNEPKPTRGPILLRPHSMKTPPDPHAHTAPKGPPRSLTLPLHTRNNTPASRNRPNTADQTDRPNTAGRPQPAKHAPRTSPPRTGPQTSGPKASGPKASGPKASGPEGPGGGERDRTDDLLLAKQALSQLSYTPARKPDHRNPESAEFLPLRLLPFRHRWWAREDLNLRPHAYQARALTS